MLWICLCFRVFCACLCLCGVRICGLVVLLVARCVITDSVWFCDCFRVCLDEWIRPVED